MDYFVLQATNGAIIGVIYALIAVGVTIIFSILKIVNFAHGDLYMLGGYTAYYAITFLGAPPLGALALSMAALFLFGALVERLLLTPLYSERTERKDEYGLLVTFGLAFFLRNTALIVFGPFPLRPRSFVPGVAHLGSLTVTWDRIFAGALGVALIIGLLYFMHRTLWGQALDAVSQSRESAAIVGINPRLFNSLAFAVGAAPAGALIAPVYSLAPDMGVLPNIQAYVVVILGGMGSVVGSIVAGILLGEAEGLFTAFFPDPTRALAYTNAFGVLVLMAVLLVRPTGLFGRRHVRME